jgi:hypothetical protein
MGLLKKIKGFFEARRNKVRKAAAQPYEGRVRPEPAARRVAGGWFKQDMLAGRITNDTYQRSRTRSVYSCRARANGAALAGGTFLSPWDLRLLLVQGVNPDKVPGLAV